MPTFRRSAPAINHGAINYCSDGAKINEHYFWFTTEKCFPQVVFEISSRGTWGEDLNKKWLLFQQFGVKEYYIFDPEYDYLPEPLIAYRLKRGELVKVNVKNSRIFSEEIGLEIVDTGEGLRLFDPATKQFMRTLAESENEITRLREELAQLKSRK